MMTLVLSKLVNTVSESALFKEANRILYLDQAKQQRTSSEEESYYVCNSETEHDNYRERETLLKRHKFTLPTELSLQESVTYCYS